MTRKEFLKLLNVSALGFYAAGCGVANLSSFDDRKMKNWIWFHPWKDISDDEYKRRLEKMRNAGITSLLPSSYSGVKASYQSKLHPVNAPLLERLLPIAKSMDLEIHAWMWTMICNDENIIEKHPDWFAVNRNGQSTIDYPAYVGYYRFMCPNNPGVREFVSGTVAELSAFSDLTGVHLDYVRLPDVILAKRLQDKYGIVQDKEYPEYDYCYCDICTSKFKERTGIDILKEKDADLNIEWRNFRYDSVTEMVNEHLIPTAKSKEKQITAAVFPNWENVRQQWFKWNLDAVLPMLYHEYYDGDINWIVDHIKKGKHLLNSKTKLYSGLMASSFDPQELAKGIEEFEKAGADGIALFAYHGVSDDQWKVLEKLNKNEIL